MAAPCVVSRLRAARAQSRPAMTSSQQRTPVLMEKEETFYSEIKFLVTVSHNKAHPGLSILTARTHIEK